MSDYQITVHPSAEAHVAQLPDDPAVLKAWLVKWLSVGMEAVRNIDGDDSADDVADVDVRTLFDEMGFDYSHPEDADDEEE